MPKLIPDNLLHQWSKDRGVMSEPTPESPLASVPLPAAGVVLETIGGNPVIYTKNDRGGYAAACTVVRHDGQEPKWILNSVTVNVGLRAIIAEKDAKRIAENPELKFSKAKVIGHAKNGRAIFITIVE